MEPALQGIIIFAVFFILLGLGLPVALCLLSVSIVFTLLFVSPAAVSAVYHNFFKVITFDVFLAVPLFVFMATVFQVSGVAAGLYDMMYKWFAGLRGGLAVGTVFICTIIAALTGIGGTGVVTIGYLGFPEMEKRGYHRSISLGCIPPGGALGPLIPPSTLAIILGVLAQESIGKLFIGGLFPGLIMSALFMLYIGIRCWRQPHLAPAIPAEERATWREKLISLRQVIIPIILIVAVLGGIYTGTATVTEAGGVGALGALLSSLVYRQFSWKNLRQAYTMAFGINAMVMWLLIGGISISSLMTQTGVASYIAETLTSATISPTAIIIIMLTISVFLGMFMDGGAVTMICIPIFIPVIWEMGVDSLWFILLFAITIIMGYITPPFGMNLFYTKGVVSADVTMGEIYKAVIPYCFLMLIVLVLSFIFPSILTFLPNKVG